MTRDELTRHLSNFASHGVSVPTQAFEIAETIDLSRFERSSPRQAALLVLRMALQKRFSFLTVRPSLLESVDRRVVQHDAQA